MRRRLALTTSCRSPLRRRTDRLYPRSLGPRELEALRLVEQRPGITIAELADELGISMQRVWQIVGRLSWGVALVGD